MASSESAAGLLDRSQRLSKYEAPWKWAGVSGMEQRFDYGLGELARRFEGSVTWVSRRVALVELLPEAIQQQVREGKIAAQVAIKFLVPVARQSLDDCRRMAALFFKTQRQERVPPGPAVELVRDLEMEPRL